jgi:dimethylamine/trimethylamine dehydrogenase
MDKEDIRSLRKWHREAALRAKRAGFDIIYCYAAHGMTVPIQFILKRYNDRTDEYGGSLENRVRLFRELIEDMKEAVGDTCAVAVRFAVDELLGEDGISHQGEGYDVVAMLAELPDLWDVNISNWSNDSLTSRFGGEGHQEKYISFVKKLTSKPVVGVGRYTSPDSMVSAIKRGILDMIGAARPSIADPFLPQKIREGRIEDIRECIGCNICVTGDTRFIPIRCTQNPTMGEEWRRGWHPERIPPGDPDTQVLIVGAGPAGLECARALGKRGFAVTLAEAREELGGRVTIESKLPGLATWARVRDYRSNLIKAMGNVDIYPGSALSARDVIDFGCNHAVIATGARWTTDILGPNGYAFAGLEGGAVFTPDDVLGGVALDDPVVIYDFDHYYMGGCLAELLRSNGHDVTIVTNANAVSAWTFMNNELAEIRSRMIELGVRIELEKTLTAFGSGVVELTSIYRDKTIRSIDCGSLVVVGTRKPNDSLYRELTSDAEALVDAGIATVRTIGDCRVPGAIVHAVYAGHECARTIDSAGTPEPVAWERPQLFGCRDQKSL